ncbi:hypothetical protein WOLCODRAFT_137470 [Wolfiporia cocos MD-104 SS10]|uniref:Endonuclease/exonuclease/phosphatase domain-containing protein n=1 Tax=Wolfiporia cocos (strain MD-104) TaxID=742152 RepID=A0A2H3JNT2_WOLCO|nr:hypothetical protein WOLCODRAFT_137470 [Wolfiporia cocos MD-104 SS10]
MADQSDRVTAQNTVVPLVPRRYDPDDDDWKPAVDTSTADDVAAPTSIRLVTWNIDFQSQRVDERFLAALEHIREVICSDQESTAIPPPCCILLQEVSGGVFPQLLSHPWVREHFTITPSSVNEWPVVWYGEVSLVSRSVPVDGARSLVFTKSHMGRNALLVDVRLSLPSSATEADSGVPEPDNPTRELVLRVGNVHLESLPLGTAQRPVQLNAAAEMLRDPAVHAGLVAGDMNPIAPSDKTIAQKAGLKDAYRGPENAEDSFTWGYQPPSRFPAARFDRVYYTCSEGLGLIVDEPQRIGVGVKTALGQWVSDHYGLVTTVSFSSKPLEEPSQDGSWVARLVGSWRG